jgi:hypothetical protein
VRRKREHVAKQASFKGMSFLLGHFCETIVTSLFLVPSDHGRTIDGIEVHRRMDLRRVRPSTPLALLSVHTPPEDEPPDDSTWVESIEGNLANPLEFLLPEFSRSPLPELDVVVTGSLTTLVLAGDPSVRAPEQLTAAFRIRNGWVRETPRDRLVVRGYVLHVPCRTLIRDLFIAEELYSGGIPSVAFRISGPGGDTFDDMRRRFSAVDLFAPIEQLATGGRSFEIDGVPNSREVVDHVLHRAGHGATRFRGWRCRVPYPVPLIEMMWGLELPNRSSER